MPKFVLRVDPHAKSAKFVLKSRIAHVKKPKPVTFTVRKPQLKEKVFPLQTTRKKYIRKEPYKQLDPSRKRALRSSPSLCSPEFSIKQIKYVAAIVCHGISCDSAKHLVCQHLDTCENPLFKTEYDLVLTSRYGDTSEIYGNSHLVANYLCEKIKDRKTGNGAEFMQILDSTIDRRAITNADGTNKGIGGALGKDTILTQKNIGDNVADLELFMDGTHAPYIDQNNNDNDSIFLFKFDPINDCDNVHDHNALTVNPVDLLKRKPDLDYVAQTAHNLQSIIEPTGAKMQNGWSDVTHQLMQFRDDPDPDKRTVRLSDILGKSGIFPEGTVVVAYVCRSTLVDNLCVETPRTSDYASVASTPTSNPSTSTPMSFAALNTAIDDTGFELFDKDSSMSSWDAFDGGAIKKKKNRKSLKKRRR
jgi:hypothetical protein